MLSRGRSFCITWIQTWALAFKSLRQRLERVNSRFMAPLECRSYQSRFLVFGGAFWWAWSEWRGKIFVLVLVCSSITVRKLSFLSPCRWRWFRRLLESWPIFNWFTAQSSPDEQPLQFLPPIQWRQNCIYHFTARCKNVDELEVPPSLAQ